MSTKIRMPHKVAKELDRELRALGFSVGFSGGTHLVWRRGDEEIRAPSSPRDWGEVRKKIRAKLRNLARNAPVPSRS